MSSPALAPWRKRIDFALGQARKLKNPPFLQLASIDPGSADSGPFPTVRTVVFRGFLEREFQNGRAVVREDIFKIITDSRSEKVRHFQANSNVELNFWFPGSNEQFRIRGKAELVGFDDAADSHLRSAVKSQWGQLKDSAREQFWWGNPGVSWQGGTWSKQRKYDFEKAGNVDASSGSDGGEIADDGALGEASGISETVESVNLSTSEPGNASNIPPGGRDSNGAIMEPPPTFRLLLVHPEQVHYLRLGDNFAQRDKAVPDAAGGVIWNAERVNP